MNMHRLVIIGSVLFASCAYGQGDSLERRKIGASLETPATQAEASVALSRLDRVLSRVVGVAIDLPKMPMGDLPVKRTDIIARFDRLFELCKPQFRFTPKKINFDPKLLSLPIGHPQRGMLERLVKWGCVGKTTALSVNKADSISAVELGDAIGLFVLRIADITHRPDPKFSPIIGGGAGG